MLHVFCCMIMTFRHAVAPHGAHQSANAIAALHVLLLHGHTAAVLLRVSRCSNRGVVVICDSGVPPSAVLGRQAHQLAACLCHHSDCL